MAFGLGRKISDGYTLGLRCFIRDTDIDESGQSILYAKEVMLQRARSEEPASEILEIGAGSRGFLRAFYER